MYTQKVSKFFLLIFLFSASLLMTSCGEDLCDDVTFDATGAELTFNGESLRMTEGSSFSTFIGISRVFGINFISDDCALVYNVALSLIGTNENTYDLSDLMTTGASAITYVQTDPVSTDSQLFKSGTLVIEDMGDGVWSIDIDAIDEADNEVSLQVVYDFE